MKLFLLLFSIGFILKGIAQTIPADRTVNWSLAGVKDSSTSNFNIIDVQILGCNNNGLTPCDSIFSAIQSAHQEPAVFYFPAGDYLFHASINLRSNSIIRGAGASATHFIINHSGSGNGFDINGTNLISDSSSFASNGTKNEEQINVINGALYAVNDWIRIVQDDADLVTSSWAIGSVGQIVKILSVNNNLLLLASPLRMDYTLARHPKIYKINPKENIGIECISIDRIDNTAPEQSSVISFTNTVNSWVNGVEINKTTFAHVEANSCSNLSVSHCYFHDAHDYGDGGRGYGVMLHFTTNECLVYSNIFSHLRHSMIVQAGANANVFCYNFSRDPYWTGSVFLPANSAGDMVLHGNYPYANLFEQNDGQNMVIDNSHGANGPYNTYFRNRGSLYGIFFSDATSPNQNLVGNEITNTNAPMSAVNYSIQGTGHFLYGNNNKGTLVPSGTNTLPDTSYYFNTKPIEIPLANYCSIGSPNILNAGIVPARYYYQNNDFFANACGYSSDLALNDLTNNNIEIFPNPIHKGQQLQINGLFERAEMLNAMGERINSWNYNNKEEILISDQAPGIYFILIRKNSFKTEIAKIIIE